MNKLGMTKTKQNAANIKRVKDVLLHDANYRCGNNMHGNNGDIEFFVGPGAVPVIAIQYYKNGDGFEVWVPLSSSNRMDETMAALRRAALGHSMCGFCKEPLAGGPRCSHCGAL